MVFRRYQALGVYAEGGGAMKAEIIWGYNTDSQVIIAKTEILEEGTDKEVDFFYELCSSNNKDEYISLIRKGVIEINLKEETEDAE